MQLPLPVSLPSDETLDSFVAGTNRELFDMLSSLADAIPHWREDHTTAVLASLRLPLLTIVGLTGRGKSHLLYGVCNELAARGTAHVYLNLASFADWTEGVFDGLEQVALICLDNIDAIAGQQRWERGIFDLLNRVAETQQTVVICTTSLGPSNPAFTLPDLRSRLTWGLTYQLSALNDDDRKDVVRLRAAQRGLRFSDQAIRFLLTHSERDLPSLMAILERLDKRSLQEQKKLSVAMVKRELGL